MTDSREYPNGQACLNSVLSVGRFQSQRQPSLKNQKFIFKLKQTTKKLQTPAPLKLSYPSHQQQ
jgi:hypothetical protein